jgi:hypothetical protein
MVGAENVLGNKCLVMIVVVIIMAMVVHIVSYGMS